MRPSANSPSTASTSVKVGSLIWSENEAGLLATCVTPTDRMDRSSGAGSAAPSMVRA
ncbi:hypothetical protein D3C72_2503190 [compost metagenome]